MKKLLFLSLLAGIGLIIPNTQAIEIENQLPQNIIIAGHHIGRVNDPVNGQQEEINQIAINPDIYTFEQFFDLDITINGQHYRFVNISEDDRAQLGKIHKVILYDRNILLGGMNPRYHLMAVATDNHEHQIRIHKELVLVENMDIDDFDEELF